MQPGRHSRSDVLAHGRHRHHSGLSKAGAKHATEGANMKWSPERETIPARIQPINLRFVTAAVAHLNYWTNIWTM